MEKSSDARPETSWPAVPGVRDPGMESHHEEARRTSAYTPTSTAYTGNGCRAWTVTANELETAIKDRIVSQRASASYDAEVRALLMETQEFARGAADAVGSAADRVASLESKFSTQVRLLSRAEYEGLDEEPFFDELKKVQQQPNATREEVEKAEEFARSREETWERLTGMIDETRNLAETWDRVGLEERRILLDWWVLDVLIVLEPVPGMRRAIQKTAIVTLRSTPDAPKCFVMGRQLASASEISSRTQASSSTDSRAASTSLTCVATTPVDSGPDTILPSAQPHGRERAAPRRRAPSRARAAPRGSPSSPAPPPRSAAAPAAWFA
jgi:hypothetical protein